MAFKADPRPVLRLAHSPDPDDVFMWWPITGMVDPRDPERVVREPAIDTGRFRFQALPADIDVLNRRATATGDLDITAISIGTYPYVRDRYALTSCGSSMGFGYGPKVVVREGLEITAENLAERAPTLRLAIPGKRTTAFLVFGLMVMSNRTGANPPPAPSVWEGVQEMPFDHILPAVAAGEVEAGLLIHQAQLTFASLGLRQVADVGGWWLAHTGLPLPLGGNALRRDLDERFGPGTCREVAGTLLRSIRHSLQHRDESIRYAMGFAPEIDRAQADRYIDMYVNDLTIDARVVREGRGRGTGLDAMRRLLSDAHRAGMSPDPGPIDLVEAD